MRQKVGSVKVGGLGSSRVGAKLGVYTVRENGRRM